MKFDLVSKFKPTGDQPQAIEKLTAGINKNYDFQTLLGVTGSGKTFTMANMIEKLGRSTLVLSHNKTLAAQLAAEFRQFFPENSVDYFVSYYDYYQPESYLPGSDTYIAKETQINDEIDRLRHAATSSLLTRRDVIIVASVSCIYGLGPPVRYREESIHFKKGEKKALDEVLRDLVRIQYQRNDIDFHRGTFRVKGDLLEIFPAYAEKAFRFSFFGREIESIEEIDPLTNLVTHTFGELTVFPATHYAISEKAVVDAIPQIKTELKTRLEELRRQDKLLEAQRLEERTSYDLELLETTGFCSGIENYSRYFEGRRAGEPPSTLIDYFPKDFLMFIDESHITIPQVRGMYFGDRARKENLVDYGFRLPSALDNRPLNFEEFEEKLNQVVFVSATPEKFELSISKQVAEQLVRPTGLLDPEVDIRPTENQIDDLMEEIQLRVKKGERVLVTTLTKRLSEDLTEYLSELGVKVQYLHSEIDTLERLEILRELRTGKYDVLVGINLLREGLDLPEVSLVAIMDADKEGFLRSRTSLVQTMGRAARHEHGRVIMYADEITKSMKAALGEVERRREVQEKYNKKHKITPTSIKKEISKDRLAGEKEEAKPKPRKVEISRENLKKTLKHLDEQMELAARNLEFERAAEIRDKMKELEAMESDLKDK
ncbi:excinuclease ABC subunit UvrB [Patescibacteria group bacterium]|nr:excinuclease ABC subunit UvrB [Patescibacteria group bacterium]